MDSSWDMRFCCSADTDGWELKVALVLVLGCCGRREVEVELGWVEDVEGGAQDGAELDVGAGEGGERGVDALFLSALGNGRWCKIAEAEYLQALS